MSKASEAVAEYKLEEYRQRILEAKFDGPAECEGCRSFACYDGQCDREEED